ncbi:bis(5'-nucleosyl)-tetraphosphatase (symmetrical) YqeK [Coleofasciculus sp. G2-EDA-02]|uniref:bis(5'-nucleosyl)-tetraphosphatase (symmetrical) YqeK n=1 Tax=Coleofasciculus sp. G2-EDA-02 TaxID=3069529 RepID=UPI0032FF2997
MRDQVLTWLEDNVPTTRMQHILRVEQMSVELARHYHLNVEQAAQAGLMHDLAKYFKPERLLLMAREGGIDIDPICAATPHLLHADVSAIVAKEHFGVQEDAVLEAIALHTLGNPRMSDISCVVFLADSLEPGRGHTPELENLRKIARVDLHKAVWLTSDYCVKHLLNTSRLIHPRMILTRNWAVQRFSQKPQLTQ